MVIMRAGTLAKTAAAVFVTTGDRGAPLVLYPLWCAFATTLSTRMYVVNR